MGTLAQNLARFRDAQGLSQQGLAEKADVPQSAISDIETGKRKNPGIIYLQKISSAFGVTVNDLLDGLIGPAIKGEVRSEREKVG